MPRKINVGIIGIGLLGSAISERLLAEGFDVVGFDLNETARNWFRQQGGTAVDSPAEVLKHASRVIICLPNSKISGELLRNLESRLQPEDLIVDVTTGHPDEMACMGERLAALCCPRGVRLELPTRPLDSVQARKGRAVAAAGLRRPQGTGARAHRGREWSHVASQQHSSLQFFKDSLARATCLY